MPVTRQTLARYGLALACLCGLPSVARPAPAAAKEVQPDNAGPYKVVTASWLGGDANDEIVACGVAPDGSILLAGNSARLDFGAGKTTVLGTDPAPQNAAPPADAKAAKGWRHPDTFGFVARLSADGAGPVHLARFGRGWATVAGMKVDAKGNVVVLADRKKDGKGPAAATAEGFGTFVTTLSPDLTKSIAAFWRDGIIDFDVDPNGDVVVLIKGHVGRYGPDGRAKWDSTFASHGDNRPGGLAVSPKTGVAAVVGYGMTKTGHEPYKDPYAYGFDRDGKQVWALWNPDPKKEAGAQFGGNGLMADTTGRAVGAAANGDLYLMLFADGGNSVCTRDPKNVDAPLNPAVFQDVFQKGPGFGFKGASKTSVIFRADGPTGELYKGTWMSAWLTKSRANGLGIDAATGGADGTAFVVGNSASGCPTKQPWYTAPDGGYQGGGFLAVFNRDFKMRQCGYFPGATIKCVAERNGTIVIAGGAVAENKAKDPGKPDAAEQTYPVPVYKPVQGAFGGGEKDGYFVVLKGDTK